MTSVHFQCSPPVLKDNSDVIVNDTVIGDIVVTSNVTVNTAMATYERMVCVCRGVWAPHPSLFKPVVMEFDVECKCRDSFRPKGAREFLL